MTMEEYYARCAESIGITKHGVVMSGSRHHQIGKKPTNPKKRGKVNGWSKDSRRRFREWLFSHDAPKGTRPIGVTLTVPGPPLTQEEQRRVWKLFKDWVIKRKFAAAWRLEVQERGSQHWHIILCIPESLLSTDESRLTWLTADISPIAKAWLHALSLLPPVEWEMYVPDQRGKASVLVQRSQITGADQRAVHISIPESENGVKRWRRYLYDHTTKAKQAQIAQGLGRHWGVIGRSLWDELDTDYQLLRNRRVYRSVLRMLWRLTTPMIPDPRAPFGRRRGFTVKRGQVGKAIWFCDPATIQRMIHCAKQNAEISEEKNGTFQA